ncbi:MAG: crossover junction endodeoxyribonuclease RuvC [Ignavibacteria bacterium]
MIILGVDPGTLITGYAVVENIGSKPRVLKCGDIKINPSFPLPLRLKKIYDSLAKIIDEFKPDEFAIETAFYSKNVQSTLKLGHARGVSILAAVNKQIPAVEYSPREIKKSVVGNGSASKEQVRYMVSQILKLKKPFKSFDVSDALAVALCHYNKLSNNNSRSSKWEDYVLNNPGKVSGA